MSTMTAQHKLPPTITQHIYMYRQTSDWCPIVSGAPCIYNVNTVQNSRRQSLALAPIRREIGFWKRISSQLAADLWPGWGRDPAVLPRQGCSGTFTGAARPSIHRTLTTLPGLPHSPSGWPFADGRHTNSVTRSAAALYSSLRRHMRVQKKHRNRMQCRHNQSISQSINRLLRGSTKRCTQNHIEQHDKS